jgi:hypothetical protein
MCCTAFLCSYMRATRQREPCPSLRCPGCAANGDAINLLAASPWPMPCVLLPLPKHCARKTCVHPFRCGDPALVLLWLAAPPRLCSLPNVPHLRGGVLCCRRLFAIKRYRFHVIVVPLCCGLSMPSCVDLPHRDCVVMVWGCAWRSFRRKRHHQQ